MYFSRNYVDYGNISWQESSESVCRLTRARGFFLVCMGNERTFSRRAAAAAARFFAFPLARGFDQAELVSFRTIAIALGFPVLQGHVVRHDRAHFVVDATLQNVAVRADRADRDHQNHGERHEKRAADPKGASASAARAGERV